MSIMMEKNLLICMLFVFLFWGCHDKEELPEQPEYPILYTFDKILKVDDFNCYVGTPSGGKEISSLSMEPGDIWGNRMNANPVRIVLLNDSELELDNGYSSIKYKYRISNDSLYIKNAADIWSFATKLDSGKLTYHLGFEFYTKQKEIVWQSGIGQSIKLLNKDNMFGTIFNSPVEMVNEKDTLAWCNVYYIYNREEN